VEFYIFNLIRQKRQHPEYECLQYRQSAILRVLSMLPFPIRLTGGLYRISRYQ